MPDVSAFECSLRILMLYFNRERTGRGNFNPEEESCCRKKTKGSFTSTEPDTGKTSDGEKQNGGW